VGWLGFVFHNVAELDVFSWFVRNRWGGKCWGFRCYRGGWGRW
jgi:hypothetical protein